MEKFGIPYQKMQKNLKHRGWHIDILNDRESTIKEGKAKFSQWSEAKERIRF